MQKEEAARCMVLIAEPIRNDIRIKESEIEGLELDLISLRKDLDKENRELPKIKEGASRMDHVASWIRVGNNPLTQAKRRIDKLKKEINSKEKKIEQLTTQIHETISKALVVDSEKNAVKNYQEMKEITKVTNKMQRSLTDLDWTLKKLDRSYNALKTQLDKFNLSLPKLKDPDFEDLRRFKKVVNLTVTKVIMEVEGRVPLAIIKSCLETYDEELTAKISKWDLENRLSISSEIRDQLDKHEKILENARYELNSIIEYHSHFINAICSFKKKEMGIDLVLTIGADIVAEKMIQSMESIFDLEEPYLNYFLSLYRRQFTTIFEAVEAKSIETKEEADQLIETVRKFINNP